MSDEELLIKYRKYKKKRMIIILIIIIFILIIGSGLYIHFNNTSSPEVNETKEEVVVKDEVAPIISLKVKDIEILKGDDINYLEYIESVIDDIDGDLLNEITYEEIDTSVVGEFSIVYSVSDKSGNSSQEILNVLIREPEVVEELKQEEKQNNQQNNQKQSNPKQNQSVPKNEPKQEQQSPSSENNNENKPSSKITKYFLFSDGYTMANVAEICAEELRKTNRTGMCSPIQDENGIYLGMKLETN
ncbi:MAG: hypothetical protein J6D28_01050 [Bacilli bacterium]|nr:hypothetical protein [Bacilli bacterium]